jgi:hypothetical protein
MMPDASVEVTQPWRIDSQCSSLSGVIQFLSTVITKLQVSRVLPHGYIFMIILDVDFQPFSSGFFDLTDHTMIASVPMLNSYPSSMLPYVIWAIHLDLAVYSSSDT